MSERTQEKVIAILAPDLSGHRLHWLESILTAASENSLEVCVFTCDGESIKRLSLNTGKNIISIFTEEESNVLIKNWGQYLKNRNMIGIVLEADKILHKLLLIRGNLRLLVLRPYLEGLNFLGLSRFLVKQLLIFSVNLKKSVTIARLSIPYSRRKRKSYKWVRDNYNTEDFLRSTAKPIELFELSQISQCARVITLPGYLQVRKNPREIYRVFIKMSQESSAENYLVFAGKQDEGFKAEILKIGINEKLIQIDRVLSEGEFKGLIRQSDLIYLPYRNRGASGIVLNSLVIGTPVLLTGTYNWRRLVKLLDGQLILSRKSIKNTVRLMNTILDQPKNSQLKILIEEDIPTVQDFFLGDFDFVADSTLINEVK